MHFDHAQYSRVCKEERFETEESILDVRTNNARNADQQAFKKGLLKGEALRLLMTTSSRDTFRENIKDFRTRFILRDYPIAWWIKSSQRSSLHLQKGSSNPKIESAHEKLYLGYAISTIIVKCLKNILMANALLNAKPAITQNDI